jgi:UDPglucose--hexose-1-phosphate uridylyltransferase
MPELRKDPIVDRWVIIARERGKRPADFPSPSQDKKVGFCPFCSGNEDKTPPEIMALGPQNRSPNSPGWTLRVVSNKFPALMIEGEMKRDRDGLFETMTGIGAHEVIIEGTDHGKALEQMPEESIRDCLWTFQQRIVDLKKDERFQYIVIFKNHGDAAGATLEHTHSQLIALPIVPERVAEEIAGAHHHYENKERCIFCDIIHEECREGKRVVMENENFIALCPFAPRFPYETWVLPKYHQAHFEKDSGELLADAASILKKVLLKMRSALGSPPYNFYLHNDTVEGGHDAYFHWHLEIMPKLTKQAGFEEGTGFYINPIAPEEAAETLRSIPTPS